MNMGIKKMINESLWGINDSEISKNCLNNITIYSDLIHIDHFVESIYDYINYFK